MRHFFMLIVLALFSFGANAQNPTIAKQDFDSPVNLATESANPPLNSFSSPSDAFGVYQRGSGSISFDLLDDSNCGFPDDDQGIIGCNKTDSWFGVSDTDNPDNTTGEVTASWTFDINNATNLGVSIKMAAMGDFEEGSDAFNFTYSIDGGAAQPLFSGDADNSASQDYTLEDGDVFTVNDPYIMEGVTLDNNLQAFSKSIPGTGNQITITFSGNANGSGEAFVFDDICITGSGASASSCEELFISEYMEGSNNNKCIEIYNPTNDEIDLAAMGYDLRFYYNGNTNAGTIISLTGTIAAGDVYVVCDDDEVLGVAEDQESALSFFFGDDAVSLTKNGTLLDVIGQIGFEPNIQWGSGFTSTQNNTIRRKASVTSGDANGSDIFDPSVEWEGFLENTIDGFGMHTSDCTTPPVSTEEGDIIVTEIMNNPSAVSDSEGEYFEVYNTTGSDIDLDGWTISDDGADSHVIDDSLIVPAGGYAVLGNNADMGSNGGAPVDYSYGSGWFLSNGGDEVILTDPSGTEIDRVEYDGGPNFPDPTGASMNLDPMALDFTSNDNGSNWCTSTSAYGDGDLGTPGAANDMCGADCTISGVVLTSDGECSGSDATFRLDFNVSGGSGNYSLVDADDGTVYGSFNPGDPDGSFFLIGTLDGPTSEGSIQVIVSDGEGCTSDPVTVNIPDCPPMATCVDPGELVITEIMQNPNTIGDSDGEYFEIYNASGTAVDLMSFVIRDNDFDAHTIASSVVIPAGGYALLARNADDAQNGGLGAAYEYDNFFLGNSGDEVILECNGTIIDAVAYDGGPNFPDPNGASMNLDPNALDAASNDNGENWCESTSSYDPNNLGTPGMPNDGCSSLPAPYQADQIGCSSEFDATFDSNSGQFELTSECAKAGFTQDRGTFVTREACGDFVFDAKLESVMPGNAYAGITVRESTAPGAKKFSIIQQPGNGRKNVEYRVSTNAGYQTYWFATWTVGWQYLRIERSGSFFLAYASFTGAPGSYQLIFTQFFPMSSCARVGMTVSAPAGQEGTLSTAVFSDVSLSSSGFALEAEENSQDEASSLNGSSEFSQAQNTGQPAAQIGEFRLFPNPATEELNIRFEQAGAEEATVRILSTDGRSVYENIHGLQGGNLNLSLRQLNMADGMYLLQIATEEEVRTERFMKASR